MGSSRSGPQSSRTPKGGVRLWVIPNDDAVRGLLVPTLVTQRRVVRTVGYFSSGFMGLTKAGWARFAESGGVMRVVCSERMDRADQEVLMKSGQRSRGDFAAACRSPSTGDRDLLYAAVASGVLQIRFAVALGERADYLMHAKTGAAAGAEGGPTVWTGSSNDTLSGWSGNYEHVISFHGPACGGMAKQVFREFDALWTGKHRQYRILPIAEIANSWPTHKGGRRWLQR